MDGNGPDFPIDAFEAGVQLAEDAFRAGRYRAALDAYMGLLRRRLARRGGGSGFEAADLVVIERLAELACLFGLFDAADDLLHSAVVLCRDAANNVAADFAQMKRVEVELARGAARAAYERLQDLRGHIGCLESIVFSSAGLAAWEERTAWGGLEAPVRILLLTRAYLAFGRILSWLGQYQDAVQAFQRAIALLGQGAAPDLAARARPHLMLAQASALLEQGDLRWARGVLTAIDNAEDELAPALRAGQLELGAKLDMLQGRLGAAVAAFRTALAFCEDCGFSAAAGRLALNLAHVLVLLNQVGEALVLIRGVQARAEALGDEGLKRRAQAAEAVAQARRRSSAEAVSVALSVREMARRRRNRAAAEDVGPRPARQPPVFPVSESHFSRFEDLALEFQWSLGSGDFEEAEARLAEMRTVFGTSGSRLVRVRLQVLEGHLPFFRGRFAEASRAFEAAEPELARMSLRPELRQLLHFRGRCAAELERPEEERHLAERAAELMSDLAHSLDPGQAVVYLLNKATTEEAYLATQLDRLLRERARAEAAPRLCRPWHRLRVMRRLDALMAQLDAHKAALADRQLARAGEEQARAAGRRRWPLALLRRLLATRRGAARLTFLVLPDRVLVVWSAFLALGFAVSPVTRLDLRGRVARWHELAQALGTRGIADSEEEEELAREEASATELALLDLAEALRLDTVLSALPSRVRELSFVPDDVLHGLPFAALRQNGRYLIERYALSIGYQAMPETAPKRTSLARLGLVVAVSRAPRGLPPLPKTLEEARSTATWIAGRGLPVRSLTDAEATRDAVTEGLQQATLAHFACHGTFEPDRPDASGLLLVPEPGNGEVLTLRELSTLRLKSLQLAVLSSCWSADNFVLPGRWIVSLPETLSRSGARSVVGSLWPVADELAAAFMLKFYSALARLPRAAALQEAQLACLSGELDCRKTSAGAVVDTRAPTCWAGFNLYGDSGWLRL